MVRRGARGVGATVVAMALVLVAPALPTSAHQVVPAQETVTSRIGLDAGRRQLPDGSYASAITPDGRYVAYVTNAYVGSNEAINQPPGANGPRTTAPPGGATDGIRVRRAVQVVRWDRETDERVSYTPPEAFAARARMTVSISDDGTRSAFGHTGEPDPNDPSRFTPHVGVVQWDRLDAPYLVDVDVPSAQPRLSGDGRYLAFLWSPAACTWPSCTTSLRLLDLGQLSRGGWDPEPRYDSERLPGWTTAAPDLSRDGMRLVFTMATGTPPGRTFATVPPAQPYLVLVADADEDQVVTLTAPGGRDARLLTGTEVSLSGDGSTLAFGSEGSFDPGDANGRPDVYLARLDERTRQTGATASLALGALTPEGTAIPGGSLYPDLAPDGTALGFVAVDDLEARDANGAAGGYDVYVRDVRGGAVEVAGLASTGRTPDTGSAFLPALSDGARYLAFTSTATDLVRPDANEGQADVYLQDRPPPSTRTTRPDEPPAPAGPTSLEVTPSAVRTSGTVTAVGTGWTGCAEVVLAWSGRGFLKPIPSVVPDDAGAFRTSILVLPHEGLGPRTLTTTCVDRSTASDDVLVTASSAQPRSFLSRR